MLTTLGLGKETNGIRYIIVEEDLEGLQSNFGLGEELGALRTSFIGIDDLDGLRLVGGDDECI